MSYEDYKKNNPVNEQPRLTPLVQTRIETTPSGAVVVNNSVRSNTSEQIAKSHTNATQQSSANAGLCSKMLKQP